MDKNIVLIRNWLAREAFEGGRGHLVHYSPAYLVKLYNQSVTTQQIPPSEPFLALLHEMTADPVFLQEMYSLSEKGRSRGLAATKPREGDGVGFSNHQEGDEPHPLKNKGTDGDGPIKSTDCLCRVIHPNHQ
jgi:hypothetical protein